MFKKGINQAAIRHAQLEMEKVSQFFDAQEFIGEKANVRVVILGTQKVKSVESSDGLDVSPNDVMVAIERASCELDLQRDKKLLTIRNQTKSKFKFDIKTLVPDVAKAVARAEARSSTATLTTA